MAGTYPGGLFPWPRSPRPVESTSLAGVAESQHTVDREGAGQQPVRRTVRGYDSGAARQALDAVHKHDATRTNGIVDEAARDRKVDEEVGVVDVLNADAEVADARGGVVCRDGLRAHGDDVRDAPIRERPWGDSSVDPGKGAEWA